MIQLYISASCPFCKKVEKAAEAMGLKAEKDYQIINAAPRTPGRDVVLKVGGQAMVPFMIDGDLSMYESDDIIAYMKSKL